MARKAGEVVARFERGRFAHDEECYRQYIAALVETGQQNKVIPDLMNRLQREGGKKKKNKTTLLWYRTTITTN